MTPERDLELRQRLADQYGHARSVINVAEDDGDRSWPVHPTSIAANEPGVQLRLWSYIAAELDWDKGLNLPLTQARSLLLSTASCFDVLGELTVMPSEPARLAGIGPVARSAAEKAATVHWVLAGGGDRPARDDRIGRLTRSLLIEIGGIERLLEFYPEIETDDISTQLKRTRQRLIELAEAECGPVAFTRNSGGAKMLSLAGVEMPSLTARVSAATMNLAYAEQSAGTHPTGHSSFLSADTSSAYYGIVTYNVHSTVHGEGRLIEPAIIALGRAMADVGSLIGPTDKWPLAEWAQRIVETWGIWCRENGCA